MKDARDIIADVFAAHGIGEIDIAVLPQIIDDLADAFDAMTPSGLDPEDCPRERCGLRV